MSSTRIPRRHRDGFTIVEIMVSVSVALTLLAITVPPFLRMIHRARTVEAVDRLADLYRGSVAYYTGTRATESLVPVVAPRQFPASVALAPATVPAGVRTLDPEGTWRSATWQALGFALREPHYYSYQYDSEGLGSSAAFTARALGDLDGNGSRSTFERTGHATDQLEIQGGEGLWIRDPVD